MGAAEDEEGKADERGRVMVLFLVIGNPVGGGGAGEDDEEEEEEC